MQRSKVIELIDTVQDEYKPGTPHGIFADELRRRIEMQQSNDNDINRGRVQSLILSWIMMGFGFYLMIDGAYDAGSVWVVGAILYGKIR